jgi:site-specific recombinase XerC
MTKSVEKSNAVKKAANQVGDNGQEKKPKAPSIEDIKKLLDEQIRTFQQKSELIAHRERFLLTKQELVDYKSEQGADFNDSLDSEALRVILQDNRKYRGDSQISIANNVIVREFVDFIISKIDLKLAEIEKEIIG